MRRMNHETCNDILAHRLQLCGVRTWRVPAASFGSDDHGCMKLDRQHSRMMPEDRLMFSSIFALLHHRITTSIFSISNVVSSCTVFAVPLCSSAHPITP